MDISKHFTKIGNFSAHRWHEEADPGHHDEHGGGEVDREDEGAEGPREEDLEAVGRVVAGGTHHHPLVLRQVSDLHIKRQSSLVLLLIVEPPF